MTTLYHPTIPNVTVEVEGKDLIARHADQGWLKSESKVVKDTRDETE